MEHLQRSITFLMYGTWDCLSVERHKVTESPQYSEVGKAYYTGKGDRQMFSKISGGRRDVFSSEIFRDSKETYLSLTREPCHGKL